ncbi:hypothetical protein [Xanthomonas arboricola]|nr:hypothetical protein [Xanthomonas arboricola]
MRDRLLEIADTCPLQRWLTGQTRADTAVQADGDVSRVAVSI